MTGQKGYMKLALLYGGAVLLVLSVLVIWFAEPLSRLFVDRRCRPLPLSGDISGSSA